MEKEALRLLLTNLTAPRSYEHRDIKTNSQSVIPVVERFGHALETIAECPTCTAKYRKKIVQSSETTEREPLIRSDQNVQHTDSL